MFDLKHVWTLYLKKAEFSPCWNFDGYHGNNLQWELNSFINTFDGITSIVHLLSLRIALRRRWKKLFTMLKNSQFKIDCLECNTVFKNDQRKKHNERWHDDMNKNKHIKWERADPAQNPFEACKKKILVWVNRSIRYDLKRTIEQGPNLH